MAGQPALVRTVFLCTWSMADDEGRIEGDALAVWRFGSFREDSREVASALHSLRSIGRILIYEVAGNPYIQIVNFTKHQRIDHPSKSKYPEYSNGSDLLQEDSRGLLEGSRKLAPDLDLGTGTKEQGSRNREQGGRAAKPEPYAPGPEIKSWAEKRGFALFWDLHLEHFQDYIAQPKNLAKYKNLDAAFRSCLRADWGNFRQRAGARTVHGTAQATERLPCGNCRKPITGAWSQSPKGRVCDPCWKHYHQEGVWK